MCSVKMARELFNSPTVATMSTTPDPDSDSPSTKPRGTGIFSVIGSVLAAGFGVQSDAARARDFQRGKLIHFIVGGIIGTVLFVLAVVAVVQAVLPD